MDIEHIMGIIVLILAVYYIMFFDEILKYTERMVIEDIKRFYGEN